MRNSRISVGGIALTIALLASFVFVTISSPSIKTVWASPDSTTYDFKDNENNKAWEHHDVFEMPNVEPENVPSTATAATQSDYDNIENSDDAYWDTNLTGGAGAYDYQFYKFVIEDALIEFIDNIVVHWEGYGSDNSVNLFVYENSDGSWDWVKYNSGCSGVGNEGTLENTVTDYGNYIYENTTDEENQFWVVVSSFSPESSCPVLYIWNGEQYTSFGTASSAGGLGFPTPQGFYDSNPKSYEVIPDELITVENGLYHFVFGEELDEIAYQDLAKLYKIYHPVGTQIVSGTVTHPLGACTNNTIYTIRNLHLPKMAVYENGENILPLISTVDGITTSGTAGEFDGIILDFGDLSQANQIKLVMKMHTDWLNEFTMQSSYAEVIDGNGNWIRVSERFDSLPEYTKHPQNKLLAIDITDWFLTDNYWLRFNDFHGKHWDFIAVDTSEDEVVASEELDLVNAELYRKGRSCVYTDPLEHRWEFDETFEINSIFEGWFTQFGDVTELLESADDMYVVMLTGDAIKVAFEDEFTFYDLLVAVGLLERTIVLESDGWYKEEWTKVLVGENICKPEPLPFHEMSYYPYPENEEFPWDNEHLEWWDEYQTRHVEKTGGHNSLYTDYVKTTVNWTPDAPTVTTNAATLVEETTATLNATLDTTGGTNPWRMFDWDTDSGVPYANEENTGVGGTGSYSKDLTTLNAGTKYYFRARAVNSGGTGTGSELSFSTKPEAPTSLDAKDPTSSSIDLTWTKGTGAENTIVRRKTGSYPTSYTDGVGVYSGTGTGTTDDNDGNGLKAGTQYFYRAWAWDEDGKYSDGYSEDSETTLDVLPTKPSLYLPENNDTITDNTPYFEWTKGENADNHRLLVDNDSGFTSPNENIVLTTDNYFTVPLTDNLGWEVEEADNHDQESVCFANRFFFDKSGQVESITFYIREKYNYNPEIMYAVYDDNTEGASPRPKSLLGYTENWVVTSQYDGWKTLDTVGACEIPSAGYYWIVISTPNEQPGDPWCKWAVDDSGSQYVRAGHFPNDNYYEGFPESWIDFEGEPFKTFSAYCTVSTSLGDDIYWWKVVAQNENGENDSDVWTFVVDTVAPSAPTLVSPENNGTTSDNTPTFVWTEPETPENYTLVIDDDMDFGSPTQTITDITDNTYTLTTELSADVYYWRVREIDQAGNPGPWADNFKLTVQVAAIVDITLSGVPIDFGTVAPGSDNWPALNNTCGFPMTITVESTTTVNVDIYIKGTNWENGTNVIGVENCWIDDDNSLEPSVWSIENFDDYGSYTYLALDNEENPHIAYVDLSAGNPYTLKHAWHDGSQWNIENVSDTVYYGSAIAVDSSNDVHVCWNTQDNLLKYRKKTADVWGSIEDIDNALPYLRISMVLENNQYPHIAYRGYGGGMIKHAKNYGSWTTENVAYSGRRPYSVDMALDENNYPHIVYPLNAGSDSTYISYARWDGNQWVFENVDETGYGYTGSDGISIDLENEFYPHISYVYDDGTNDGRLKYAHKTQSGWSVEMVDNDGSTGYWSSIQVDSSNQPNIAYSVDGAEEKFARKIGGSWVFENIDVSYSSFTILRLDSNNVQRVAYGRSYAKKTDTGVAAGATLKSSYPGTPNSGFFEDVAPGTVKSIYFWISVPVGTPSLYFTNTIYVKAVKDGEVP